MGAVCVFGAAAANTHSSALQLVLAGAGGRSVWGLVRRRPGVCRQRTQSCVVGRSTAVLFGVLRGQRHRVCRHMRSGASAAHRAGCAPCFWVCVVLPCGRHDKQHQLIAFDRQDHTIDGSHKVLGPS